MNLQEIATKFRSNRSTRPETEWSKAAKARNKTNAERLKAKKLFDPNRYPCWYFPAWSADGEK